MASEDKAEKTITATVYKKKRAKRDGDLPRSKEFPNIFTFVAAVAMMYFLGPAAIDILMQMVRRFLLRAGTTPINRETVPQLFWELAASASMILGPLFIILMTVAIVFSIVGQGGWSISVKPFVFRPSKFNPVKGIKKIFFSPSSLFNLLKSMMVVAIVSYITYETLMGQIPEIYDLIMTPLPQALDYTFGFIFAALFKMLLLFIILAIIDLMWTKHTYEKKLKMTKREFKDEIKTTEGDPQIKRRIRSIQYQQYRRRMMAAVPEADVVVTNPTHFAVALSYNVEKSPAPEVVAKGRGLLAEKIRSLAIENEVPIVENPGLAQTLYRSCEVGSNIPPDLYKAVAEILAYVYKLRGVVPA